MKKFKTPKIDSLGLVGIALTIIVIAIALIAVYGIVIILYNLLFGWIGLAAVLITGLLIFKGNQVVKQDLSKSML